MKKYVGLHLPLIERITREKQREKNPDKAMKTRLHQIYGAYIRPNSNKKAEAIINQMIEAVRAGPASPARNELASAVRTSPPPTEISEHSIKLLELHSSTNERLPFYEDFYGFIFGHIGAVSKVLDLGCGFNPFSIPFFLQKPTEYHAIDIDLYTKDLLNVFFEMMHLPRHATCEDLETVTPQVKVDLALMLKLFPVLESNSPGRAYRLANELSTTWLVVSFPTKSLGGKKKGMAENYAAGFQDALSKNALNNFQLQSKTVIGNELIFILKQAGTQEKPSPSTYP